MTSTIMDRNLVVERYQASSISIPANGATTASLNVAKSGYTPIGIVGHANGLNTNFYAYEESLTDNTLKLGFKSVQPSAITVNYVVYVLYQRT
jgi:hypothetical protein